MIHPIVITSQRIISDDYKARRRYEILQEAKRIIMEQSEKGMFSEPHKVYW